MLLLSRFFFRSSVGRIGASGLLAIFLLHACPVSAQHRLASFASFKRIEADPAKSYGLRETHGPWLILAASFAGPSAENEAQTLVLELRKRFKLNAYTWSKTYDFSKPVTGQGVDEFGKPLRMRHRIAHEYEEIAVMVGDFPSINDPELQRTLKQIKYIQPACLQLEKDSQSTQRFAGLRAMQRHFNGNPEKKSKGPLGSAFVARNPLLPQEYFTPTGFDGFVADMNKDVEHSLLDCKREYSVRVATFRGNVVIDQQEVAKIEKSGGMKSELMKAAWKAHRLVELLRERGVEAYEFHDRHESIVTVGSFDSVGTPRADGKIEIDPNIHKVIKNYGPSRKTLPNGTQTGVVPKTLDGIMFDIQPVPVKIPRRSIAADYAHDRR